jgi:hypothetical protein
MKITRNGRGVGCSCAWSGAQAKTAAARETSESLWVRQWIHHIAN